ncbi:MAG TPA: hypothetical protein VFJ97_05560 [Dermatophilaceae bacterium]|nr:hypothetical protein [Dermatophilaceae bacterium]
MGDRPATVVPEPVRVELARVVQRWRQLPLDQARSGMPQVRAVLARLDPAGSGPPDLGPAVVMHQLAVLVWDDCAAGGPVPVGELPWLLSTLRLALA